MASAAIAFSITKIERWPKLEKIDLSTLNAICKLENLERLQLNGSVNVNRQHFDELGKLKSLKQLELHHIDVERMKFDTYSVVHFDLDKRAEVLVGRGKPGLAKLGIAAGAMISKYSEARVLDYGANLEPKAADRISHCKNLKALKVGSIVE